MAAAFRRAALNPGGFLETCDTAITRPRVSMTLPDRGPFTFPAPYNTRGIRITNANDMGENDALWYCGYSYWRNINAHVGEDHLLVFLSTDRQRGGDGPSLWTVDKRTDAVTFRGTLFPRDHPLSYSTGEGWYWSASQRFMLYGNDLTHLYRINVEPFLNGAWPLVTVAADAGAHFPGRVGVQWHTSANDAVHSCTIKTGDTYEPLGSAVYNEPSHLWAYYPAHGTYDECQIDASGHWLLVKENIDNLQGEDNLIYRVGSALELEPRVILDEEGAAGHSDNGFGYMVAADNWASKPSAFRVWPFDGDTVGTLVYWTPNWDARLDHVSHQNAQPGVGPQYVVGSGANRVQAPRNNEVIAFRVDPDARGEVLVIAPVLTDLDASGGGTTDYAKLPKGNVDITGQYFLWTSNLGGDRLDALVVKVPSHLLVPAPQPPQIWTVTDPQGVVRRFKEVS